MSRLGGCGTGSALTEGVEKTEEAVDMRRVDMGRVDCLNGGWSGRIETSIDGRWMSTVGGARS